MQVDDVVGAAFLPTDGQASPLRHRHVAGKGRAQRGRQDRRGRQRSPAIEVEGGRVRAVATDKGRISCDKLVICAGQWSRELGRMAGVNIPLVPVQHQYLITEANRGRDAGPADAARSRTASPIGRRRLGGLVMGGYEPNPKPWAVDGASRAASSSSSSTTIWSTSSLSSSSPRVVFRPCRRQASKQFINGPESFTPDGNFILGEAPEVRGIFVGAGFNAFGIAAGGGAGMALAEWVAKGEPPYDLWPVDIRRFGKNHLDTRLGAHAYARGLRQALHDGLAVLRSIAPGGRCRRSPLYDRLKAQGACFGEKLGWERPNWFADAGAGEKAEDRYSYERQNWFDAVGREHTGSPRARRNVRPDVASPSSSWPAGTPRRRCHGSAANDVAKPPGHLVYTQMLNDRGGIECDLTVGRLSPTEYYIVTGTGFATHDFDWISRGVPDGLDARLIDVTSSYAVLSVMGPRSREVLQGLTERRHVECRLPVRQGEAHDACAGAPVLALRVTYVGELGWELHIPVEFAASVYDALMAAGEPHGIANARLPRHRVAAPGEGLSRLGRGYRARPLAARRGPRLGGEAEIEQTVPGARSSRGSGRKAAAAPARRVHRRSLDRAARARDHLSRRQARRLARRAAATATRSAARSATATSATLRTASIAIACSQAATSSRSPPCGVPAEVFLDPPVRPRDVAHQELSRDRPWR